MSILNQVDWTHVRRLLEGALLSSFSSAPRCVAHGRSRCPTCSLNPSTCAPESGAAECGTYAEDGMHWDTCPNRVRGLAEDGRWIMGNGKIVDPVFEQGKIRHDPSDADGRQAELDRLRGEVERITRALVAAMAQSDDAVRERHEAQTRLGQLVAQVTGQDPNTGIEISDEAVQAAISQVRALHTTSEALSALRRARGEAVRILGSVR